MTTIAQKQFKNDFMNLFAKTDDVEKVVNSYVVLDVNDQSCGDLEGCSIDVGDLYSL